MRTHRNCTFYHTSRVFRLEDRVQNVKIFHPAYGEGIGRRFNRAGGGRGAGFVYEGSRAAPAALCAESTIQSATASRSSGART